MNTRHTKTSSTLSSAPLSPGLIPRGTPDTIEQNQGDTDTALKVQALLAEIKRTDYETKALQVAKRIKELEA